MAFLVIIICFCVQWFLNFSSTPYRRNWASRYLTWMNHRFEKLVQGYGLFDVLILVLPLVIIASLFFTIVYHLTGHIGYSLVSLVLLWYCVDITCIKKPCSFLESYQKIFAPLFWYFIFGPVGLVLYVMVGEFHAQLPTQKYFSMTKGVLDWVPVRLLGLSFALAGNFGGVFKEWRRFLFEGISDNYLIIQTWGDAALAMDKQEADALALIHRSLIIWLGVMALISIGIWFG